MFASSRLRFVAARHLTFVLGCFMPCAVLAQLGDFSAGDDRSASRVARLDAAAERRVEAMARVAAGYLAVEPDPDSSLRHYLRALDLDPSNAPLAQEISAALMRRDQVPEALGVLKDSLKHSPRSAPLALRIAGIYVVSLRKLEAGERYAKRALESDPDLIEAYQMLYSIHRADGRTAEAKQLLERASRRENINPAYWAGLGDLWLRHLLMEGKLAHPEESARALVHFRRAADLGQQDPAVLLRALNFFSVGGYHEDAFTAGQRLLLLQPSDSHSREKVALALAALGREDEALAELDAVVAENPASLVGYRAHGEILLKRKDLAGALAKFEKSLLLSDDDPRLYLEVADLCVQNEKYERAAWWLAQAREKYNRLPELPYYEGQLLAHLKRWREALHAFDLAASMAEQFQPTFFTPDFHFHHGVVAERSGEHAQAARHFQACLRLDDNYAPALNYLGYMWAERGENLAEAETYIRRALGQDPDSAAYLDSLGWVLYQQGRFHEALPLLEQASRLSTAPDPTIEEHLGDVLDKLGRRAEALEAWERAVSMQGASADVKGKLQAARGQSAAPAEAAQAAKP
jgi:tetratricopeptide (TPR) repeat protein